MANFVLFCAAVIAILYATILTRTPGSYELILTPFATFTAALPQPELYREMLMNVFLFFPLGLTLSNALPRKWHRWGKIALTTLVGCALSAGIEYAQYRCALGLAATPWARSSAPPRCSSLTPSKNTKKGLGTRT